MRWVLTAWLAGSDIYRFNGCRKISSQVIVNRPSAQSTLQDEMAHRGLSGIIHSFLHLVGHCYSLFTLVTIIPKYSGQNTTISRGDISLLNHTIFSIVSRKCWFRQKGQHNLKVPSPNTLPHNWLISVEVGGMSRKIACMNKSSLQKRINMPPSAIARCCGILRWNNTGNHLR